MVPSPGEHILATLDRRAFTIVELLVVIAIIAILVGLLLPAVQSAREAARTMQCRNHIKQISLAVHLHENQYKRFPDGGLDWHSDRSMTNGVPEVTPRQNWGWLYQILPFIEQGAIYAEQSDSVVESHTIPTYFCPSRRSDAKNFHLGRLMALNDYAGNGGLRTQPNAHWGNGTSGGFFARSRHSSPCTTASIRDGLSNTIMAGEKSVEHQSYYIATCADNEGWTDGWDWDTIRWSNHSPIHDANASPCASWFGAVHQGGCQFAFGDGSVHTLSYSIDGELFRSLCHREDAMPTSLEF